MKFLVLLSAFVIGHSSFSAIAAPPNILLMHGDNVGCGDLACSDNGAFMLPGAGLEVASNTPLRDSGTTSYEGGVRVPAQFRWPGKIQPGTVCHEMLSHLDVQPLCLAAGLPWPKNRVLDGRDPLPALTGQTKSPHQRLVFQYYDLASDPSEQHDRATERPQGVQRLAGAYARWHGDMRTDASEPVPNQAVKK